MSQLLGVKKPSILKKIFQTILIIIILFISRIVDALFLIINVFHWLFVLALSGRMQMGLAVTKYGKKQFESTLTDREKKPVSVPKFKKKYGWK
jgi:hypothetical protein